MTRIASKCNKGHEDVSFQAAVKREYEQISWKT